MKRTNLIMRRFILTIASIFALMPIGHNVSREVSLGFTSVIGLFSIPLNAYGEDFESYFKNGNKICKLW